MSAEMTIPCGINSRADWRDPSSYQPLLKLDRAGWAWKWLRRNPDYIARASRHKLTMDQAVSIPATDEMAGWGLLCPGESSPASDRGSPILAG